MEEEKIKVTFYASTGYQGSAIKETVEANKSEWKSMKDEDKLGMLQDVLYGLDYGWYKNE